MDVSWVLISGLASTGIVIAVLSCLVGMRQKIEIPLWWMNYAAWVMIVLLTDSPSPFLTIVISSLLAGVLHGTTQAVLLRQYRRNNPWYEDRMRVPDRRLRVQFILMGVAIGGLFGAVVGGIAWGLDLFL